MNNYYYDVSLEDGTCPAGLRPVPYRQAETRERRQFDEIMIGDFLPAIVQGPITRTQIVKYAGASYDFNPIHHDEEFAQRTLSGGIIAHGMMIMGYLGKCATAYLGTAAFNKFTSRNLTMTRPGDVLVIEGLVEEKTPARGTMGKGSVRISLTAKNQATGELMCTGEVTATID